MARGQDGSLRLSCMTLTFTAPRRFIPTLSSPARVLVRQAPDQYTNLFTNLRSADARPRAPPPVKPETSAVPADDGRGFDDDEDIGPARPTAVQVSPKSLSSRFKIGRDRLRLSTATCCQRARTSRAVSLRPRKKTRSAERSARIGSTTNSPFLTWRNVGFRRPGQGVASP